MSPSSCGVEGGGSQSYKRERWQSNTGVGGTRTSVGDRQRQLTMFGLFFRSLDALGISEQRWERCRSIFDCAVRLGA